MKEEPFCVCIYTIVNIHAYTCNTHIQHYEYHFLRQRERPSYKCSYDHNRYRSGALCELIYTSHLPTCIYTASNNMCVPSCTHIRHNTGSVCVCEYVVHLISCKVVACLYYAVDKALGTYMYMYTCSIVGFI